MSQALSLSVKVRLRNWWAVFTFLCLLTKAARWINPETVLSWGNRALGFLKVETQIAGGPWTQMAHGLRMVRDGEGFAVEQKA